MSDIPTKWSFDDKEKKLASLKTSKAINPDEFPDLILNDCVPSVKLASGNVKDRSNFPFPKVSPLQKKNCDTFYAC